jgi:hypothetical protein
MCIRLGIAKDFSDRVDMDESEVFKGYKDRERGGVEAYVDRSQILGESPYPGREVRPRQVLEVRQASWKFWRPTDVVRPIPLIGQYDDSSSTGSMLSLCCYDRHVPQSMQCKRPMDQ